LADVEPALKVRGLRASYGKSEILKGLDLDVGAGETVVLLGANGCGKSTSLNVITGFVKATAGTVTLAGHDISRLPPHETFRRGLVQVSQKRDLFPESSVEDNLKLGAFSAPGRGEKADRLDEVYSYFPRLKERRDQRAQTLSGGEQQMIAIGRALMSGPKMLLLDEPSGGLAPRVVEETGQILRRIKESGMTILMVEQHLGLATSMADRFYILREGQVRSGDELVSGATSQDDLVRRIYL
jgi:branched-chain amino acid transport system ATP-binding protein